jgi:hypothetical protein
MRLIVEWITQDYFDTTEPLEIAATLRSFMRARWTQCKVMVPASLDPVGPAAHLGASLLRLLFKRAAKIWFKAQLALFNLGIDSKLRGCDLVALKVRDVCHGEQMGAIEEPAQREA